MADAGARRHDAKVGEALLSPFQEPVALLVLLVFARDVLGERARRAEMIDHHRMVDDEVDGNQRIDLLRIAAKRDHRVAHRGEIDHGRHAGEVLHQHPRRAEGDFVLRLAAIVDPRRDRLDVFLLDRAPVFVAQQVFEHDLEREGKLGNPGEPVPLRRFQGVNLVGLRPDGQCFAALEAVEAGHFGRSGRGVRGREVFIVLLRRLDKL